MSAITEIVPIGFSLSPEEIKALNVEQNDDFFARESVALELKAVTSDHRKKLKEFDARMKKRASEIRTGKQMRPVECFERMVWPSFEVELVRKDNGDVASVRAMHPHERQERMHFEGDVLPAPAHPQPKPKKEPKLQADSDGVVVGKKRTRKGGVVVVEAKPEPLLKSSPGVRGENDSEPPEPAETVEVDGEVITISERRKREKQR